MTETRALYVRMPAAEYDAVRAVAEESGLTLAMAVRLLLRVGLDRRIQILDQVAAVLPEHLHDVMQTDVPKLARG